MARQTNTRALEGRRVAILCTDGVEEVEMTRPRQALIDAGAETALVSPKQGKVQAFKHHDKSALFDVDVGITEAKASDFDALLLPGGALNPDQLRMDWRCVSLVRDFARAGKPIAVICHGPWTLIDAEIVRGKKLTSWPSIKKDLTNAGADWVDEEVVVDELLVSSRKPDDIPAFNAAMIEVFAIAPPVTAESEKKSSRSSAQVPVGR